VPEANWKKLDPKGRQPILLSYLTNGKGYRLWDLASKKIVTSRDVSFENTSFPYKNITPSVLPGNETVFIELPRPN
jgi:hypothetical protein